MSARTTIPRIPSYLRFRDDVKPYVELVHGRRRRKMSPKLIHGTLQGRLATWLCMWGEERGEIATEWRCYLLDEEQRPSCLVPDVAFMSYERLPRNLPFDARQRPRIAPDIAVEIWSPGDPQKVMQQKLSLYFWHGSRLVIVVYPEKREIAFHTAPTDPPTVFPASGTLRIPGYDDLTLDAEALFRKL